MKKGILPWYYFVIFALIVRGLMFVFFINEHCDPNAAFIGEIGGDTESYLNPVDNYLENGNYDPDYRMPGYGVVYLFFRLFLSVSQASNFLILLQSILSGIAVYVLALTTKKIFESTRLFYLVYFGFLVSTYSTIFDIYLLTESFAVSSTIFGVYFLVNGLQKNRSSHLFLSGLMITWCIFLRPVYAPYLLLIIFLIAVYCSNRKTPIPKFLKLSFIFLSPFIILDGAWTTRNYKLYGKVLPLMKSVYYPEANQSYYSDLMDFLQSWGGSYIFWDPSSEIRWFGIKGYANTNQMDDSSVKIPDAVYTSKFNKDSLLLIKNLISILNTTSDSLKKSNLNEELSYKLRIYTASVKEEHKLLYNFTSRLIYFKKFLLHSGTYNLFNQQWSELSVIKKAVKLFYSFQYIFILITGILGCILLIIQWPSLHLMFPFITLYSIVLFPLILRLPEMRYFVPAFPFILICSMYVTNEAINRFKSNRLIKNVK